MNWIGAVVGAACGILAVGITTLVVFLLKKKGNKSLYSVIFVVTMALFLAISREHITPKLLTQYAAKNIEESLLSNSAFAAIKQYDVETYNQILEELKLALSKGQGETEAIVGIRNHISTLVQKRIPHASDEAAASYMTVMVQELTELQKNSGNLCYQFMFSPSGQTIDITNYVSETIKQADLNALSEVVKTSAITPQEIPNEADISATLEQIVDMLINKHGEDVALLQNPLGKDVNKTKVCEITIDMYQEVLQLPPEQSGKLIRYLLGQPN